MLNSTGDPAGAAPYFVDAHRLATEAGVGGLAIDALHMQAIAAGAVDGPDAARAIDERALAEVEASDDPQVRRWLGSILNNLGWDLHDSGHPEEALAVFERAVEVRAEADDHAAWLVARWCVGRTLRTLGRYDEALALMRELAADPSAPRTTTSTRRSPRTWPHWTSSPSRRTCADSTLTGPMCRSALTGRAATLSRARRGPSSLQRDARRAGRPGRSGRRPRRGPSPGAASRNAWSPTSGNMPRIRPKTLSMPPPASAGISSR